MKEGCLIGFESSFYLEDISFIKQHQLLKVLLIFNMLLPFNMPVNQLTSIALYIKLVLYSNIQVF